MDFRTRPDFRTLQPGIDVTPTNATAYSWSRYQHTTETTGNPSDDVTAAYPEFLNYLVAFLIYSLRYAAVFWYTKMALSILFSVYLIFTSVYLSVTYCGMAVLYKFHVNSESFPSGVGQHLVLTSTTTLLLSLLANVVTFLSSITVFNYGYMHYRRAWKSQLKHRKIEPVAAPTRCHGYTQHATAIVFLLTLVGLRLPVVFDLLTIYRKTGSGCGQILACIVADVTYTLFWIVLWFGFTVKQSWDFKVILMKPALLDSDCPCQDQSSTNPRISEPATMGDNRSNVTRALSDYCVTSSGSGPELEVTTNSDPNRIQPHPIILHIPCSTDHKQFSCLTRGNVEIRHNVENIPQYIDAWSEPSTNICRYSWAPPTDREPDFVDCQSSNNGRDRRNSYQPGRSNVARYSNPVSRAEFEYRAPQQIQNNMAAYGNTPENTLTRGYYYSIRDKCGQYFPQQSSHLTQNLGRTDEEWREDNCVENEPQNCDRTHFMEAANENISGEESETRADNATRSDVSCTKSRGPRTSRDDYNWAAGSQYNIRDDDDSRNLLPVAETVHGSILFGVDGRENRADDAMSFGADSKSSRLISVNDGHPAKKHSAAFEGENPGYCPNQSEQT